MPISKVSVIVPVYNVETYISECILSIINQTYSNIEIILVDDGSIDQSFKICQDYAKANSNVFAYTKKNSGVSDTRNFGIQQSTGEYILFVDSDDTICKNCVETLISLIDDKILPICSIKKHQIKIDETKNQNNNEVDIFLSKEFLHLYTKKLLNSPVGRLYKKDILIQNHLLFDNNLSLGEDLLFNLAYIKYIDKILVNSSELYNYRLGNSSSLSQKYRSDMKEIQLKIFHVFLHSFPKSDISEVYRESLGFITTIFSNELHGTKNFFKNYICLHQKICDKDIKKELKKLKKYINKVDYFLLNHFYLIYILKKKWKEKRK